MQNHIQKFRQSSTVFERPLWRAPTTLQLIIFPVPETFHTFPTYQYLQKGAWDFFNFV